MRNTFIKTLIKLARNDSRIVLITPDLGFSVLEEFEEEFPERFFNVGIAEQNAVGIASGLALCGKIVYIYSIIPFITMRPFEQIRNDVAYMNTNVRLIGVGAGLTYGAQGATHHAIEDVAIMRALPNMTVLTPCDPYEVKLLTEESVTYQGPIYIRLAKKDEPILSNNQSLIKIGKLNPIIYNDSNKITIFFMSNASDLAMYVYEQLQKKGINADIISVHTVKPFNYNELHKILLLKKFVFTIEEHNIIGGLGSLIAEHLAELNYNINFKRFALNDIYSHYVGNQDYIRNKMGLNKNHILNKIISIVQNTINGEINE